MTPTTKALYIWLMISIVSTLTCGLVFISVQQSLRQGANDPQIQMAQDIAAKLSAGATVESVVPKESVDIEKSLAPFVTVADENGQTVASSAMLDAVVPKVPSGVFDYVASHGEDRVTWQPRAGVRQAIVVTSYDSGSSKGFVVAGRSLKEVEKRTNQAWQESVAAWCAVVGVSLIMLLIGAAVLQRNKSHHAAHHA